MIKKTFAVLGFLLVAQVSQAGTFRKEASLENILAQSEHVALTMRWSEEQEKLFEKDFSLERRAAFCWEMGIAYHAKDLLEDYLNYIDSDEEMLFEFTRRDEYLELRHFFKEDFSDLVSHKACVELISAAEFSEAALFFTKLSASIKKYKEMPVNEIIREYFKFAQTWKKGG